MTSVHIYPEGCIFKSLDSIKGAHVTIMGLGLNGGGEASARFFLRHGAVVTVTDMKSAAQLQSTIDSIASDDMADSSRLIYHLGGHIMEDFSNADCVIKNPGVKYEGNKYLAAARVIETDISVFLALSKAPIIAVTGSKGKSSTVSATHWVLTHCGFDAFLGGNITVSPLTFLEQTTEHTPVVLELSSWQLADLRGRGLLHPYISIITKIVSDHQNWYGDMASYVADKRLIYECQTDKDYAIFDAEGDEPGTAPESGGTWGDYFAHEARAHVLRYGHSRLPSGVDGAWQETDASGKRVGIVRLPAECGGKIGGEHLVMRDLLVPGEHVRTNALNAALAAVLMGANPDKVCTALSQWPGVEHRLQRFYEWTFDSSRLQFYDDSCSTVSEATAAACSAFDTPIILIAGGTDKGLGQEALARCIAEGEYKRNSHVAGDSRAGGIIRAVYLLDGTATDKLIALLDKYSAEYYGPFDLLDTLLEKLRQDIIESNICHATSMDGETIVSVVFSPGATSFGMFANEFERGDKFQDAVRQIFVQTR